MSNKISLGMVIFSMSAGMGDFSKQGFIWKLLQLPCQQNLIRRILEGRSESFLNFKFELTFSVLMLIITPFLRLKRRIWIIPESIQQK